MKALRSLGSLLALMTLSFLLMNCEQKSSTGPSSSQPVGAIGNITLTAGSQELYAIPGATATTQVTATVTDTAGTAMPGILVKFTTPAIGSISSTQDSTNEDGQVSVTYNSQGQYGLANISASVTSGTSTKTGFITIGIYPLTGVAHDITVSLSPDLFYLAPGADDSTKVTVRVMDSLNVGIPSLHVTLSTTLGIITFADTTNQSGTVVTYLHTNEEFGMGIVTASVNTSLPDTGGTDGDSLEGIIIPPGPATWPGLRTGKVLVSGLGLEKGSTPGEPPQLDDIYTISDIDTFWVFPVDQQIGGLSIGSWPTVLNVPPDTIGTALISAHVVDANNNGIPGVPIGFATNLGMLASSSGTTDSSGTKSVTYYSLTNVYGQAKVWAVVGPFSDTTTVTVAPTASANGSLFVYGDNNLIYADNGITFTNVHALLKDADNQAISNALIVFTSDHGTINSPVLTDFNGLADAIFQDIGFASFPDSATIIGKYNPLNLSDSISVMIAPARGIDHIVLNAATNSMIANGLDSTKVDATVYLENNALAPPGTDVNFIVGGDIKGHFTPPIGTVVSSGTATVYYYAGSNTGQDSLFAEVDGIYSNPVVVQLNAGPPTQIEVVAEPTSLPVNSLEMATVTATVRDTTGNLVGDNVGVVFSTTLGSISPLQAQTVNGVATSFLSAANTAGPAWVTANVGADSAQILIQFIPSEPAFITLASEHPSITVVGAGGNSQTAIYATVKDASGNPVGNGVWVHFQILNNGFPFGGVNINNRGIEDSTVTSGGVASAVLNAGVNPGPVQIRAWTVIDSLGTEISVQQSLVTIVAGPPDYIDVNAMSQPNGELGGDTWQVEVSALVLDALGNEVAPGNGISFYPLPDSLAQFEGGAYTGNHSLSGDSLPGVAFTVLTYHTPQMFQVVTLVAYCMVGTDSVIGTQDYLLPLDQDADLDLAVIPEAWNYDYPPPGFSGDPAIMECKSYLVDGHGNAVNNATIIFYSTKGDFFFFQNGTGPSNMKVTGPGGFPGEPYDSTGYATLWLRTWFTQAFPEPTSLQETGTVHSQVMGFFNISSDPVTVTYTHNASPPEPSALVPNED